MKRTITVASVLAFVALSASQSSALEMVTNGGFETGDLTGWTPVTSNGNTGCDQDWNVNSSGTAGSNCFGFGNDPIEGTYAAYNSFDGDGPQSFIIEQDITLGNAKIASAELSWLDTVQWSIFGGSLERIFSLYFQDDADGLIGTAYELVIGPGQGFTDWTAHSEDVTSLLSGYEGETVTLVVEAFIPQFFTGPAALGADAFSLHVEAIPEPSAALLFGIGAFVFGTGVRRRS